MAAFVRYEIAFLPGAKQHLIEEHGLAWTQQVAQLLPEHLYPQTEDLMADDRWSTSVFFLVVRREFLWSAAGDLVVRLVLDLGPPRPPAHDEDASAQVITLFPPSRRP